jgi:hypothetical protein
MKNLAFKFQNILLLALLTVLFSCEKLFISPDPENTPMRNFEIMWNDVHERYAFFELKGIDWDSVYTAYLPLIDEEMSEKELFEVLASMLYELKDGHVNLTSSFDRSRNWDWFLDFSPNYNPNIVERNYLGKDFRITGPFRNQVIDSVLYFHYGSFSSSYTSTQLNELIERAQGLKGVIVDVRNNGGGSFNNAFHLAARFSADTVLYARERTKIGKGINDFSSWIDMNLEPHDGKQFLGNVVVLSNRSCYSATTFFSQMMRSLPNVVLLGEQTGGGGGIPASYELPNGWTYRFSITQTVTPDGIQIEPGVPVDINVALSQTDEQNGVDTIIEEAIKLLKEKAR